MNRTSIRTGRFACGSRSHTRLLRRPWATFATSAPACSSGTTARASSGPPVDRGPRSTNTDRSATAR
ncbi:hypothetical protein [Kitasatospora cineracea]|uniref:hypothetical protein n=1 Tax=Kitasatospora cineracea TaxID=88074 RepID=UPI000F4E18C7|nr:hypothetical protein [Kitasatospora cineracea]